MKRIFYIRKHGRVTSGEFEIHHLDYTKETAKYYMVSAASRFFKEPGVYQWFSTWKEAHEALKVRAAAQLEEAEHNLTSAQRTVEEVPNMVEPKLLSCEELEARRVALRAKMKAMPPVAM